MDLSRLSGLMWRSLCISLVLFVAQAGSVFAGTSVPTALTAQLHEMTGDVTLNWQFTDYHEDFQDGIANSLTPVKCAWAIMDGAYYVTSSETKACSSYLNRKYTSSYILSLDAVHTKRSTSELGIFFNGDPSTTLPTGEWNNAYVLRINAMGSWRLGRIQNGTSTDLQSQTFSSDLQIEGLNRIAVSYDKGKIEIYFNGVRQGEIFDNALPSGKIGLFMYDAAIRGRGAFDNIEVIPLDGNHVYNNQFNVYRNNTLIGSVNNNSLGDTLPAVGSYNYRVHAVLNGKEGPASETRIVSLTSGTIQFEKISYQVVEGEGSVRLVATRTGGFGGLSAIYETFPRTATAADFTAMSNTVEWGHGDIAPREIVIPITDDILIEEDETFEVSFCCITFGGIGGNHTAFVTIVDDDKIGFSPSSTVGIAPLGIRFTDNTTLNVSSWRWDFGDGFTSGERSPFHVYDTPGIYKVVETVTAGNSSWTTSKHIHVLPSSTGNLSLVPDDYATIQAAVNNSLKGDTVFVREGVYTEQLIIDREISLVGAGWRNTEISTGSLSSTDPCMRPAISIIADNVTVTGFTIQGGYPGIDGSGNGVRIDKNRIMNNVTWSTCAAKLIIRGYEKGRNGLGISFSGDSWIVTNNLIIENSAAKGGEGCGIFLVGSNNSIIENNTIARNLGKNSSNDGHGIGVLAQSSSAIIKNNIISDNDAVGGFGTVFGFGIANMGSTLWLANNSFYSNDDGWVTVNNYWGQAPATEIGTMNTDPLLRGIIGPDNSFDYSLRVFSPCIDAGTNPLSAGELDILWNRRSHDGDGDGTSVTDIGAFEYGAPPWQPPGINLDQDGDGDVDGVDLGMLAMKPSISDKEVSAMSMTLGQQKK